MDKKRGSIFKWETLCEIEKTPLEYGKGRFPGRTYEVEMINGEAIRVWRADDGQEYFCHGLTFGGKHAPGGIISPYGKEVPAILGAFYEPVAEANAQPGDILVWRGLEANDVIHSALLTVVTVAEGQVQLDYSSRLQTKNGIKPETNKTLGAIILEYGESYNPYRRK